MHPPEIDSVLIPLVVGVAGHRDLVPETIPAIEAALRKVFEDLRRMHDGSPMIVLSALAEGADRVVARIALEFDARLVVTLPMPIAQYRHDFGTPESQTEFDDLLGSAAHSFELPLVGGNTPADIAAPGMPRDMQYGRLGDYIARHSEILIALWDGVDLGKSGGTGHVVRLRRFGLPDAFAERPNSLHQPEGGLTYHLMVPRLSNPEPARDLYSVTILYPEDWGSEAHAAELYRGIARETSIYNRDVRDLCPKLRGEIDGNKRRAVPPQHADLLGEPCAGLLSCYAVADTLASRYRTRRVRTIRALFLMVLAAFVILQLNAETYRSPGLLLLYPLILALGWVWYSAARGAGYETKHEDYRALAEAMRVQLFWGLAAIDQNVSDHYLLKHRGELQWIRFAVRGWTLPCWPRVSPAADRLRIVADCWVAGQRDFFERKAPANALGFGRLKSLSNWLFLASGVLALLPFGLWRSWSFFAGPASYPIGSIYRITVVAIGMLLAAAAALYGYAEKTVLSEQARQYGRMAPVFRYAHTRLVDLLARGDLARAQAILLELGKEALAENADWLLLHRAQPLEVPRP